MDPVVKLIEIERTYSQGAVAVRAVRSVCLEIMPGEFVAIMGASGSGKSTLMNILGCLDRPTAGSHYLDQDDVSRLQPDQLAQVRNKKLGFVFQNFNLLSRTSALENVELPMLYSAEQLSSTEMRKRASEMLAAVGLAGREDHTPSQLSGGQQQRVALARALVNHPRILLADEPTGNLDSKTSVEVIELFQKLNEGGLTIIMVTHEPDIAACAKRVIAMKDGEIVSDQINPLPAHPTTEPDTAHENRIHA